MWTSSKKLPQIHDTESFILFFGSLTQYLGSYLDSIIDNLDILIKVT